jgi:BirA family biotin operon repressor/biotin-[acetyl-CoA-carboxylase] ligase
VFDLTALGSALVGSIFAEKFFFTSVTESTNIDAMAAARAGAAHGSVYFSDEQRAGRGRGGHRWHSTAGDGLYVSVVLRSTAPVQRWPLLPLCAGLAAMDTIRAVTSLTTDLRWPNDVLIGAKKVCGILVEAGTDSAGVGFAVVGIGINVHQRAFSADLATPATSLDLETGGIASRQKLLVRLLESLQRETEGLAKDDAARRILAKAESSSTWLRGRRVEVHGPQACTGLTAGLDEHGFLRVQTSAGTVTVQTGGIRAAEMD